MGDTSETNTKVLSRELFLGVVALKRLYRKIIICATRTLFSGTVTYMQIIEILNFIVSSTVSYLELCLSGLTRMYTENFSAKKFYMKIIKSTYHIKCVLQLVS